LIKRDDVLSGFPENERARRPCEDAILDHVIDALNEFHEKHGEFHEKHGLLSDEFPSL
jgi:hypothetical protein